MRTRLITMVLAAVVMTAGNVSAATPEQKCEAGKNDAAGRYFACLAKAERAFVLNGDTARYDSAVAKCPIKFNDRWNVLETAASAAASACPSEGDADSVRGFLHYCEQSVAAAVGGGALPDGCVACPSALVACQEDLATAEASLSGCTGDLGTCNGDLTSCTANLSTTNADLGTCNGNLTSCNDGLTACTADLVSISAGLTTCEQDMAVCSNDLWTADTNLQTCNGTLTTCNGDLTTCNTDLTTTSTDLATCQQDLAACAAASGASLARTGQTAPYGTGSDGAVQAGAARSFTDNGDGTITDHVTGLMWEKKDEAGAINDKDNTYTWSTGTNNMDGTIVTTFLATLNADAGFAGHTDWRLPNLYELESIRNLGALGPAAYDVFNVDCAGTCTVTTCSCTPASRYYWSSSTFQVSASSAWYVDSYAGAESTLAKTSARNARAVRNAP